jgi:hypothetical protein
MATYWETHKTKVYELLHWFVTLMKVTNKMQLYRLTYYY